jgi:hypothetical protein
VSGLVNAGVLLAIVHAAMQVRPAGAGWRSNELHSHSHCTTCARQHEGVGFATLRGLSGLLVLATYSMLFAASMAVILASALDTSAADRDVGARVRALLSVLTATSSD